jgi:Domain of unknown function (DUF4389)
LPYPVTFEVDYFQRRSRLTAFFRVVLAIPAAVFAFIYGIAAFFATVVAWFSIVLTGHYPSSLYHFVAGFTRVGARYTAYVTLLCDPYPPFSADNDTFYPVRMEFAGPLPEYDRLKTFFRFILAIPILFLRYVINALLELAGFGAWVVIVVTGGLPRGLFDVMVLANSYTARSDAYLLLLTETYPPFQDETTRAAGAPGPMPHQTSSPS